MVGLLDFFNTRCLHHPCVAFPVTQPSFHHPCPASHCPFALGQHVRLASPNPQSCKAHANILSLYCFASVITYSHAKNRTCSNRAAKQMEKNTGCCPRELYHKCACCICGSKAPWHIANSHHISSPQAAQYTIHCRIPGYLIQYSLHTHMQACCC